MTAERFKLNPPPVYDEHYAATQAAEQKQPQDHLTSASDKAVPAPPMLSLAGNLCEMGELELDFAGDGFRIERPDGRVITVIGLSHEEVRGLKLFVDVALTVEARE